MQNHELAKYLMREHNMIYSIWQGIYNLFILDLLHKGSIKFDEELLPIYLNKKEIYIFVKYFY